MRAGAASNIGEIHYEFAQPNQDNFLVNTEQNIYAVFDGHGDQGHVIAAYLKENLASTFTSTLSSSSPPSSTSPSPSSSTSPPPSSSSASPSSSPSSPSSTSPSAIEDSLKTSFNTLDSNICKESSSESSGSTCVMAYVDGNNLYVAGVGDCSALLVKADPSSGKIEATSLVTSHKITNNVELERIQSTGASVNGEYVVSKLDPSKVINMTRAFGDQDMKCSGIISLPEISVTQLTAHKGTERAAKRLKMSSNSDNDNTENSNNTNNTDTKENKMPENEDNKHDDTKNDTFLLLFSDGLEQVQSFDDIAKNAYQLLRENLPEKKDDPLTLNTICTNLLQKLEDMLVERDGGGFSDDTTVVLVLLSGFS
eukprot:Phypoly_transcript_10358.p1 GENE.Phypoly_transcript_10358~~Phypoly_transcript_10358.p1  ORF type:complete len:379 (+),score=103.16 Phypoly_transcript_10358:34-1137(+)